MLRRIFTASLAIAVLSGISTLAWAQGRGGMGGTSAFGGSGMGSSGFGGMGMGSSGFGGMGMGGMGRSGFGGMGMGSSGFGGMGMGGTGMGGMGTGGSAFGNSMGRGGMGGGGMYGGQQGGGQAFVGRDGGDMSAVFNQMGRAGTQFFNQMNRNARGGNRNNRNNRNQQNNAGATETAASNVRVRLELGFTPTRPTPNAVANTVRTRLASVLTDRGVATPNVSVDGGVVVLRGVAASETQRQVLAQLIALEPGVMGVRNEMTVAGANDQN